MKRRILEINAAIQARRSALQQQGGGAGKGVTPELRAEWQRLLKAVAESGARAQAVPATPSLTARVILRAARPSSPIEPDRPLLLLVGAMIALGSGVLLAVLLSALGSRRGGLPAVSQNQTPLPSTEVRSPRVRIESPPLAVAPIISVSPTSPDPPSMPSSDPSIVSRADEPPPGGAVPSLDELTRTLASSTGGPTLEALQDAIDGYTGVDDGPTQPGGRSASSQPPAHRGPVIEVNAPVAVRETDELEIHAPLAHRLARDPLTRVTQVLGSPLHLPGDDRDESSNPASHAATQRSSTSSSSTSYSYVSTAPPASTPASDPAPSPRRLRSHVSSRPPATDPQPASASLPAPSSQSGRPVVSPRLVSPAFQPDAALLPASRRELASELYPLAVERCFVIGVTGLKKTGEETARVAAELALALAETGHPRVLLLEGNLQRPAIQRWLHLEMPLFSGFTEQLDARVQTGERRPWTVLECTPSLHALAEGVMRTPELILSPTFQDSVRELRTYYDFIVIDGPLTSELSAYRAFHEAVDGVVLVSTRADGPEVAEAAALFSQKRFSTVLAAG